MGAPTPPPHRVDVRRALGGGSVADLLLWRRWLAGVALLFSSTATWFLFERAGYNLLSFAANTLFLLVLVLFLWAKSAALLNRPLPPLPDLEVSEDSVAKAADVILEWINHGLSIAREITVNRNLKLFFQVACGLGAISYIGSLFNFLTLVYIGVVLALSVPFVYDKYQDHINDKLCVTHSILQKQYKRFDERVLKKIPVPPNKEKKIE
ncbi:reticulon-like protein B11 [Syzygium oleosum]|uniref:reticulon-like protein B11 n=1 Tax=Syzygium oleosum TaxID=219896 RepID=UPI0011D19156|nr:reticulon-like protein B11 [Syzygium oleosum]XP_030444889.1 reticulon-like protein B11 [Syzygium oleosum]XP_056160908.1 reticulon-like protein B11 [Syzygium oleosum]XP_056160909.1 reticulon-like protein B11 [Syzygium oleosum]XP_056160910.1 reticulon-like protein B11 [Syzygium oleosum]